jgi:hypothetical protein
MVLLEGIFVLYSQTIREHLNMKVMEGVALHRCSGLAHSMAIELTHQLQ